MSLTSAISYSGLIGWISDRRARLLPDTSGVVEVVGNAACLAPGSSYATFPTGESTWNVGVGIIKAKCISYRPGERASSFVGGRSTRYCDQSNPRS